MVLYLCGLKLHVPSTSKNKVEDVTTTRSLWVPAVNNCGQFGQKALAFIGYGTSKVI